MNKLEIMNYLVSHGLIAIVRADNPEGLSNIVESLHQGGIHAIELTMTTPGALDCIEKASARLAHLDVCIGVGSVLDAATARMAILAGAQFVVSPVTVPEVIQMAHTYGKPCLPGAFTPTEIYHAWMLGGDIIKVFPASCGGLEYIKAIRAPLPQIPLAPTGGVNLDNLAEFVKAGVTAIGIGGNLVSKTLLASRNYAGITETARLYANAFAEALKS